MTRRRRTAVIIFLIVDVGYILWGGMAAFWLDHLVGPHGVPILPAGYEGYTQSSWAAIASASPMAASYMGLLFRMYGVYNFVVGLLMVAIALTAFRRGERWAWWALLVGNTIALVAAMTYDRTVNAIGPFEMSEYVGLGLVWIACAITAPFGAPLLSRNSQLVVDRQL
jgi:hypothetical protein